MSIAATAEQLALRDTVRDWAKRAGTLAAVRALEPASTPDSPLAAAPGTGSSVDLGGPAAAGQRHWKELASLGVFAIGRPPEAGGA